MEEEEEEEEDNKRRGVFFSYFFTFRIHEAWTLETSKKKAIFEKYVDVLCVYVIYIYIYIYMMKYICMMMNVVHNCAVVRSFVLLLLS